MVVDARIAFLLERARAGSPMSISISFNNVTCTERVNVKVEHGAPLVASERITLISVLLSLGDIATNHICSDKGHKHSSGTSITSFG